MHLQADVLDALNQALFLLSLTAQGNIQANSFKTAMNKRPKPFTRPTLYEVKKEKPKFLTGRELKAYLMGEYPGKIQ